MHCNSMFDKYVIPYLLYKVDVMCVFVSLGKWVCRTGPHQVGAGAGGGGGIHQLVHEGGEFAADPEQLLDSGQQHWTRQEAVVEAGRQKVRVNL